MIKTNNTNHHPPGVYVGLPFEEYLNDPALSRSGMKDLIVSPMNYWIKSWMNPQRKRTETSAMFLGTAVHCRILDGFKVFSEKYAVAPTKNDHPGAVDGSVDLKSMCKGLGIKSTGTIAEMCERIHGVDPNADLWPVIQQEFKEVSRDKKVLSYYDGETICRIAEMIFNNTVAREAFKIGIPEVTVFWPDAVTGIPMKARLDYIKPGIVVELKTFSNFSQSEVGKSVASATARYGYNIQAIHYLQAAENAREMIKKSMIYCSGSKSKLDIIHDFAEQKNTRFFFVFVETSQSCDVIIREYKNLNERGEKTLLYQSGKKLLDRSKKLFTECKDKFGEDPWIVEHPVETFTDEMFPAWSLQ